MSNGDDKATEARIIRFCNGAARTWDEIVSCISGCNAMRSSELSDEDQQKVTEASYILWQMCKAGTMSRECASDPREDLYSPIR